MLVHLSTLRFALGSSRIQFWMGASEQRLGPRISTFNMGVKAWSIAVKIQKQKNDRAKIAS